MSALATIVGSLGELSESELRQLYLMVGVRLGIPDVPTGALPQQRARAIGTGGRGRGGGKTSGRGKSSGGNPQRKSQWANHPLYQEYSRLKKVVEAQAKEAKTSFNAVNTAESRAYRQAFTQWVEAKHSFRGHGESGQKRENPVERNESDEESDEEAEEPSSSVRPKGATPPAAPAAPGQSRNGDRTGSPPVKGKAVSN